MAIVLSLLLLLPCLAFAISSDPVETNCRSEAGRLQTGTFHYQNKDHGKEVGQATITIMKLAGTANYAFSNDATFASDFSGFTSQQWKAIASPAFRSVSAELAFIRGTEPVPVFFLQYSENRVTGFVAQGGDKRAGDMRRVDVQVPGDVVDQRIDWARAISGCLNTGQRFEFHVYDPGSGVSRVMGHVESVEQIHVPAGTFPAYRIIYQMERAQTTERFQMFASRESPHVMLREIFPNGVVTELVRISNPTGLTE